MKKKILVFSVVAICLLIIAALIVATLLLGTRPPVNEDAVESEDSLIDVSGARIILAIPFLQDLCRDIPLLEIGNVVTQTTISLLVVTVLLVILAYVATKKLTKRPGRMQVVFEKLMTMLYNLVRDTMGEHNMRFAPYIGTLFLSSIFCTLIGMTQILPSATKDLSVTLAWALVTTGMVWYNNIKNNGFIGWLKGFTEPMVVMTPMNIISEIAQPLSMAFRHFGNLAGGGVITTIIYTAFALLSSAVLNAVASVGWLAGVALMAAGVALWLLGMKKHKLVWKILAVISFVIGLFGLLQALNILTGVPILSLGIPALLSCYFDIFSGFVQALVFTLLSMVYIAGALPQPQDATA